MIGGQAGITGHLSICDDVVVSAGTLVSKSINRPGVYTANLPLQAHADWMRNFAHLRQLDNVVARLRQLESARPAVVAAPPPEAST
jgi:UDP-3-O-[3-hydroxymyristoyl] glucosamine N-acyltransferase